MASDRIPVSLGDVADILTGFPFKSDHYSDDESMPRLLRGDNVIQGRLRWEGVKRWHVGPGSELQPYWLREDDVVLAMDRPWIEAGLKYAAMRPTDLPALLVQRVARMRGINRLSTKYLRFILGSQAFTDHVLAIQTGTAVPHISKAHIANFRFLLPPMEEQESVVRILGALDDKIELNRKVNGTLEAIARALFKSWFVDFDPVRAKAEGRDPGLPAPIAALFPDSFEDSSLGEIPRGWSVEKLSGLASLCNVTVSPGRQPEQMFALFSIPAYDNGKKPAHEPGSAIKSNKFLVPRNSVLLSKLNPSILRVWLPDVEMPEHPVCSTEFLPLVPREWSSKAHLYSLLMDDSFRTLLSSLVGGTSNSHQRVSPNGLLDMKILNPGRLILSEYERLAAPAFERVQANIRESSTLGALRDALLPKLITGELRLGNSARRVAST